MTNIPDYFINTENLESVFQKFDELLRLALNFKNRDKVSLNYSPDFLLKKYLHSLGLEAEENVSYLFKIIEELLDESVNFSSKLFMGFPDAGNSISGVAGAIIESLCQQNMINSSFCARAATFIEISTVVYLRGLVGYEIAKVPESIMDLGGVATTGGTCSNMYGLLMARKRRYPDSFSNGMPKGANPVVLVPEGITHYSIAGSAGLIGLGKNNVIGVATKDFRMDLESLQRTIIECEKLNKDIICVVLNAGDSRTLTIDNLTDAIALIRELIPDCWIHIDACHGGQLLFSNDYRYRINGIEKSDSLSLDPHKVLNLPYTSSFFLFKNPAEANGFWTSSSLIMGDPWALGQLTPNIGSKSWSSLKLYLLIREMGYKKIAAMIDNRIKLASRFKCLIENTENFILTTFNNDINSVPFICIDSKKTILDDPKKLFAFNKFIYEKILSFGRFYLHGFEINDDCDILGYGKRNKLFVLRYMCGNPLTTEEDLMKLIRDLDLIRREAEQTLDTTGVAYACS